MINKYYPLFHLSLGVRKISHTQWNLSLVMYLTQNIGRQIEVPQKEM